KTVRPELVTWAGDSERIAREALAAATHGARVLVIRNTVADCRAVQLILEELAERHGRQNLLFRPRGIMAPHHSRYAKADRQLLDKAIEAAFGRGRASGGCVAVATQTVEQSLDLDADLLITDLCPIDVLLQRIGRLHRHKQPRPQGFGTARAIVLGPVEELAAMIGGDGEAKGPHGLGPVYEDLRTLEVTRRILNANPEVTIPADNRRLVENGTHPDVLRSLVEELGGPWEKHQRQLQGRYSAEGRIAGFNLVDRTKGFAGNEGSILFPSGDTARKIPTRLGENDRLVRFAKPWISPFGCEVKELSIPAWLLDAQPSDQESKDVQAVSTPEGVTFRFGTKELRYDRLGLALSTR
ncbi:MAG: CRISPR-associated helicase/endonuclease Cas3, partial [bacterium]|nr:CRISPR-associated helicase/endonuclease Cas3 [bacterium]